MIKTCKICGREFETNLHAQTICSAGCKKLAEAISKKRAKQKYSKKEAETVNNETKATITETTESTNETETKDIVIETLEKSITDNLELLDAVREELLKVLNELRARQSAYDQNDFAFLHAFEGTESDEKLLELAKQCKANRHGRRDYKNYIKFINDVIKTIPINSVKAFEDGKKTQNYRNIFYSVRY